MRKQHGQSTLQERRGAGGLKFKPFLVFKGVSSRDQLPWDHARSNRSNHDAQEQLSMGRPLHQSGFMAMAGMSGRDQQSGCTMVHPSTKTLSTKSPYPPGDSRAIILVPDRMFQDVGVE